MDLNSQNVLSNLNGNHMRSPSNANIFSSSIQSANTAVHGIIRNGGFSCNSLTSGTQVIIDSKTSAQTHVSSLAHHQPKENPTPTLVSKNPSTLTQKGTNNRNKIARGRP